MNDGPRANGIGAKIRWPLGVALAYAVLLALVARFGAPNYRVQYDANHHHLPTVLKFARQWPWFDLREYAVVSTPGYHLVLATFARFVSEREPALRGVGAGFTLLLAVTLVWGLGGGRRAAWLALPVLASAYVIASGVWLLPENAAWWLLVAVIGLAVRPPQDAWFYPLSAAALVLLVLVRQPYVWACAVTFVAAIERRPTRREVVRAGLAVMPAVAALGVFVWLWHGLVPPVFQADAAPRPENLGYIYYGGATASAAGMTLALLGSYGPFFVPFFFVPAFRTYPGRWRGLAIGAGVGLLAGAAGPSAEDFPFRQGTLFRLMDYGPVLYGRSTLFIALAGLGGGLVVAALIAMPRRDRRVLGTALVAFAAAQSFNPMVWQRYYEPMVLIWLAFAASRTVVADGPARVVGPALLAGGLLAVAVATLGLIR